MKQVALLLVCSLLVLSCKKTATSINNTRSVNSFSLASVSTTNISLVTDTSAMSGGGVISIGNSSVIARGICWSTSHYPTIANDTTVDGSGIGWFVGNMTRLIPNTTYYVRAYATNNAGTAYGKEDSFTTASPPPPPFSGTFYGTYRITDPNGTSGPPQNIIVQLFNNVTPSGFIDGNTYTITSGSFNPPHLVVTAFHQETFSQGFPPHPIQTETVKTWLTLDGQLVDNAWSGTITLQQQIINKISTHAGIGSHVNSYITSRNFSGNFECYR